MSDKEMVLDAVQELPQSATFADIGNAAKRANALSEKRLAIQCIANMPDSATIFEINDELALLASVQRGIEDADEGRVVSTDEMRQRLVQWLAK